MNARAVLMGGMGYPATETIWGMPTFKSRLEAIGIEVLLISWSQRQEAYNFMHGFTGKRFYAGDSLGAGSAGQYPDDVDGVVDYAAGFQPSLYDARTVNGVQTIASRLKRAHCIYDPVWIETVGLGNAQWTKPPNSETILLITQHQGAHPDDWGWSQTLIYNEIKGLLDAPGE